MKSLKTSKTYTGITDDLQRRLYQHNQGYHKYTKQHVPWKILYTEEQNDRVDARAREKYLKSAAGRRWIKKILFN